MSVQSVIEAIDLLREKKMDFECSGAKSVKLISEAETILNCKLPESYHYFLEKLGNFYTKGFFIYGLLNDEIGNVTNSGFVWGVLNDRRNFQFPDHIITLDDDRGDGSAYALDLSQMNKNNECPVVIWPLNGYEDTPVLEIISPDFGTWFLEQVQEQIKLKKEN